MLLVALFVLNGLVSEVIRAGQPDVVSLPEAITDHRPLVCRFKVK